jgi:hypothetical protein
MKSPNKKFTSLKDAKNIARALALLYGEPFIVWSNAWAEVKKIAYVVECGTDFDGYEPCDMSYSELVFTADKEEVDRWIKEKETV